MQHKCKITVIQKDCNKKLGKYVKQPEKIAECNLVELGQEFIVENMFFPPEGMCESAWADIRSSIMAIATGGEFDIMSNTSSIVSTCSDPFRPVLFLIERCD